ncbi:MAG: ABC transporter permease [Bacteroidota bacterium]
MIYNNLKTAIRNLRRNKLHSAINIVGLSVGLAAVMCIAIYLQNEWSFDRFHVQSDQLYRVGIKAFREGTLLTDGHVFTPPIGPAMRDELAGIKNYTRYSTIRDAYFSTGDKSLKVEKVSYADSTFFSLFSFPLLEGHAGSALAKPNSLVLAESMAMRLFGETEIVGRTVQLNNGDELHVAAVAADPPINSHIQFEALISFSTLYQDPGNYMDWNGGEQYITFVQLGENATPEDIEEQLVPFMWRHINEDYAAHNLRIEGSLQPLSEIHLAYNPYSLSLRTNLYVIGAMAFLILIVACINFINITTALAGQRAMEVGVRKVLGASRASLGRLFLGEAFLLIGIAFLMSLLLVEAALPFMPNLIGKPLNVPAFFQLSTAGGLLLLLVIVGIGAGSYPSWYLASFDAVKTLKGARRSTGRPQFRQGLVVFQFAFSIALIISTLIIGEQLNFIKTKTLGFDKENVVVVPLVGADVQSKVSALKQELQQSPQVAGAAACSEVPGRGFTQNGYRPEGMDEPLLIKVVDVDEDYFDLFGLELKEGRFLSNNKPGDQQAYLINETLANRLGWEQPIGKIITRNDDHTVVGLVKDFHYATLHQPIEPLIVTSSPWQGRFDFLAIKLTAGHLDQGIQAIRQAWQKVHAGVPMDYRFLDDDLNQIYEFERRLSTAFLWCSGLSIFVALLGIFGLTTYSVEQRRKEIGIRKVLGATTAGLVGLLSKDFLKLVVVAFVIASPLAYYSMENWLTAFAYRIEISWGTFVLAGMVASVIASLTVGFQSVKAALANPVKSLRSE